MKIALAQIESITGDITANIQLHLSWTQKAKAENASMIVFPELSLTAYEPKLADELAMDIRDERLNIFQEFADQNDMIVCPGVPVRTEDGVHIAMIIFRPLKERMVYFKQILHDDELPYFIPGNREVSWKVGNHTITPAICYESLQKQHNEAAQDKGTDIYLASVAKSQKGIDKAYPHFASISKQLQMNVLMCNNVGFCDDFTGAGQSAYWDLNGLLQQNLNNTAEGLLIAEI